MAIGDGLKLADALEWAREVSQMLRLMDTTERYMLVGSVRRRRPVVHDLEFLVQLRRDRLLAETDLFGAEVSSPKVREHVPLWAELDRFIESGHIAHPARRCWGDRQRRFVLHGRVQVEIFTATPRSWGAMQAIRTGPAGLSKRLVTALRYRGMKLCDGEVWREGVADPMPVPDEETLFRLAGTPCVPPEQRDALA